MLGEQGVPGDGVVGRSGGRAEVLPRPGHDQDHEPLNINGPEFDAVAMEIAATLNFLGVPAAEHKEFMDIIESFRPQVVTAETAATPA